MVSDLSSREARPVGRSPNISTNWSCGDGGLEEVNTSTGRRTGARGPSRLCRRAMFARWLRLQQQVRREKILNPETLKLEEGSRV